VKVFHLINTLSVGGAELHLLTLSRYLAREGIDVVVGCLREYVKGSRSLAADFEREAIRVVRFGADRRISVRFFPRLLTAVRAEAPDIFHSHLPRADFAAALAHRVNPQTRWVSSIHDVYSKSWSGRWALPLFTVVWRRAAALIAISGAVRDWLVRERRIPPSLVTVIRYGIDAGAFVAPASDLKTGWGLNGRRIVGSIGRLEPRKGHDTLIRAMPAVLERVPDAVLLIAGHDPWRYGQTLQALIDRLGIAEQVRLVGFQADVPSFLHALDVFAFASRSEGFGQVLVEVMAAGKPIVTSNIAPMTEIVHDPQTGFLVRVDDPTAFARAIAELLGQPQVGLGMGARGQQRVREHFSAARMASETAALYRSLLMSRR